MIDSVRLGGNITDTFRHRGLKWAKIYDVFNVGPL